MSDQVKERVAYEIYQIREERGLEGSPGGDWEIAEYFLSQYMWDDRFMWINRKLLYFVMEEYYDKL